MKLANGEFDDSSNHGAFISVLNPIREKESSKEVQKQHKVFLLITITYKNLYIIPPQILSTLQVPKLFFSTWLHLYHIKRIRLWRTVLATWKIIIINCIDNIYFTRLDRKIKNMENLLGELSHKHGAGNCFSKEKINGTFCFILVTNTRITLRLLNYEVSWHQNLLTLTKQWHGVTCVAREIELFALFFVPTPLNRCSLLVASKTKSEPSDNIKRKEKQAKMGGKRKLHRRTIVCGCKGRRRDVRFNLNQIHQGESLRYGLLSSFPNFSRLYTNRESN